MEFLKMPCMYAYGKEYPLIETLRTHMWRLDHRLSVHARPVRCVSPPPSEDHENGFTVRAKGHQASGATGGVRVVAAHSTFCRFEGRRDLLNGDRHRPAGLSMAAAL